MIKVVTVGGFVVLIFAYIERRTKKMSIKLDDIKKIEDVDKACEETTEKIKAKHKEEVVVKKRMMSPMEREELVSRIKGMTLEELGIVVDTIPIELCLGRINREIDKLKSLESKIKSVSETL